FKTHQMGVVRYTGVEKRLEVARSDRAVCTWVGAYCTGEKMPERRPAVPGTWRSAGSDNESPQGVAVVALDATTQSGYGLRASAPIGHRSSSVLPHHHN